MSNKERFLAGHKFTMAGYDEQKVFSAFTFNKNQPPCGVFQDSKYGHGIHMGNIDRMSAKTLHMYCYLMGERITYTVKFADMQFIESEVPE